MKLLYYSLALYLSLTSPVLGASSSKDTPEPEIEPCTVRSPTSGNFFDLNKLRLQDPLTVKPKPGKRIRDWSWNTTGYDLGYNISMNFCGPVLEDLDDVEGVKKEWYQNISAFYKQNGKYYSLGLQNEEPIMRGRKLLLNYTGGSPCPEPAGSRRSVDLTEREIIGMSPAKGSEDEKDDGKKAQKQWKPDGIRRKSALIVFSCDKDPLSPLLSLSYVGSVDECSYYFEARTSAACVTVQTSTQTVGPAGVFGVIALISILVYLVGGCFYSRAVLQQRGWKQLPNYSFWAGIFGFFRDLLVILTSSCTRLLPSRRGYSRVNGAYGGSGERGRGRGDSDAENRLIDELNEEWDD